jgi:hypothetical protein
MEPDSGVAERTKLIAARLADIDQAEAAAKADNQAAKWIAVRALARDVVELYDDESDATVAAGVKKARGALDAAKGK